MLRRWLCAVFAAAAWLSLNVPSGVAAESLGEANHEFFEKRVRPVLAENCFECHGPGKQENELRLDSRAAMLKGGSTGPAIVPNNPKESLLITALHYADE